MSNFAAGFLSGFAPQIVDMIKKREEEKQGNALRELLINHYYRGNQPQMESILGAGSGAGTSGGLEPPIRRNIPRMYYPYDYDYGYDTDPVQPVSKLSFASWFPPRQGWGGDGND